MIDPLSVNKQGNDRGRQYRTGVYYTDEGDREVIAQVFAEEEKQLGAKIAVELEPLRHYILAEDYHQDYLKKNPGGYCHIDVTDAEQPLIDPAAYQKPDQEILKAETDSRAVPSHSRKRDGTSFSTMPMIRPLKRDLCGYYDGEPLFFAKDKFASGCGWPSFSRPIAKDVVHYYQDHSHGMERIEVRSRSGNAHLGHVFTDGPKTKEAYVIVSIRPRCALFKKKRWSKKVMDIC